MSRSGVLWLKLVESHWYSNTNPNKIFIKLEVAFQLIATFQYFPVTLVRSSHYTEGDKWTPAHPYEIDGWRSCIWVFLAWNVGRQNDAQEESFRAWCGRVRENNNGGENWRIHTYIHNSNDNKLKRRQRVVQNCCGDCVVIRIDEDFVQVFSCWRCC